MNGKPSRRKTAGVNGVYRGFSACVNEYFQNGTVPFAMGSLKKKVGLQYLRVLLAVIGFRRELHEVDWEDMERAKRWLEESDLDKSERYQWMKSLKGFFNHLHLTGKIPKNPGALVYMDLRAAKQQEIRESQKPEHDLDQATLEKLFKTPPEWSAVGIRNRALFRILMTTDIQICEVIRLKQEDTDAESGTVWIKQGWMPRKVDLDEETTRAFQQYQRKVRPLLIGEYRHGAVFVKGTGAPATESTICQALKLAYQSAGITRRRVEEFKRNWSRVEYLRYINEKRKTEQTDTASVSIKEESLL